jgi:hypothetical protein
MTDCTPLNGHLGLPMKAEQCTRADTIRPSVAGILQRAAIGMKRPIGAHQQQ